MTAEPETILVEFEVTRIERVRDRGRLLALACVRLEVLGLELVLQGVRLMAQPDGQIACLAPCFRHPDGRWLPAILMPPELSAALAADVLAAAEVAP